MANQSTAFRPQPPSIKDPKQADMALEYVGEETEDSGAIDQADEDIDTSQGTPNWTRRAKDAYRFSTSFVDSNYRKTWEDSIRAFNNEHPSDSKYNSEVFKKRSNIFVPKTRSIIRKNEAAAAAAFFSNLDRISVTAVDQSEEGNRVSAEVMEGLLQHRLTKSIPWFQICMGAIQDGQTMGACIAHVFWRYATRKDARGKVVKSQDKPCIDLIPLENMRFDPSAHWTDPLNTSPYLIQIIPMYVVDVKQRMSRPDPKGRQWKTYPDSALTAYDNDDDTTRRMRTINQQDPARERRPVSDYDICWVHRHIHRWNGTDYEFYMLASEKMLTEPEPLENVVFHGQRPYVMGVTNIETHKALPSTLPAMVKGLQEEINEIKNSRLDNVKFVLNKGYFAKRGKNVDLPALVRNVPGRVVLMDDTEDVVENQWQDVTQSSYLEEDRNNANFDELVGNFSAASVQTARAPREPARAMTLLQAPSTVLTEYMLKTFSETFVGPVLRQLVLLEQHYETDPVVLGLAGAKSKLFKKFGMDAVTDDLLERELSVNVNVGMGSTDPVTKLQKFLLGIESYTKICVRPPPGVNLGEVLKEIMALTGYQDGQRFALGDNPELAVMQAQMKQMQQKLQQLMIERKNKEGANAAKVITQKMKDATFIKGKLIDHDHDKKMSFADHLKELHMHEVESATAEEQADSGLEREGQKMRLESSLDGDKKD
jgi:hypothetical protein